MCVVCLLWHHIVALLSDRRERSVEGLLINGDYATRMQTYMYGHRDENQRAAPHFVSLAGCPHQRRTLVAAVYHAHSHRHTVISPSNRQRGAQHNTLECTPVESNVCDLSAVSEEVAANKSFVVKTTTPIGKRAFSQHNIGLGTLWKD
jgi:hypothetical protein